MTAATDITYRRITSPIGELLLAGRDNVLEVLGFPEGKGVVKILDDWQEDDAAFSDVVDQLSEYFAGTRQSFDLKLNPAGTAFQLSVLEALKTIPYGQTRTYRDIANRIGKPNAVRAVGAANGRNPIPIIIPCHRVIGSDGSLTGFGGGLPTKQFLLNLEAGGFQLAMSPSDRA